MQYTGRTYFKTKVEAKAQADGAQEINVEGSLFLGAEAKRNWQVQVGLSAAPSAGTLTVSAKTPGADSFVDIESAIDLTAGNSIFTMSGIYEAIRLTPASLDADKTWSAFLSAV